MLAHDHSPEGGAVGVVLIQFSKRFRPVVENGNKERHLRSPLEASSQPDRKIDIKDNQLGIKLIPMISTWDQVDPIFPVRSFKKMSSL
jgi:hypothetical protein